MIPGVKNVAIIVNGMFRSSALLRIHHAGDLLSSFQKYSTRVSTHSAYCVTQMSLLVQVMIFC
jgi:hypothetical protein